MATQIVCLRKLFRFVGRKTLPFANKTEPRLLVCIQNAFSSLRDDVGIYRHSLTRGVDSLV